jgi:allophanate hydrolase
LQRRQHRVDHARLRLAPGRLSDVQILAALRGFRPRLEVLVLCGIAVPTAPRSDGRPGSITLLSGAGRDADLTSVAAWLHHDAGVSAGATDWPVKRATLKQPTAPRDDEIELAVVGAHMSGLPLNGEVTRLGGRFLRATKTAPDYRLYALSGGPPARPGLVRSELGQQIALETWALPKANFGKFMLGVPSPLGIGTLRLETGETVKGFICETAGLNGATDVTEFGGWRAYLAFTSGECGS